MRIRAELRALPRVRSSGKDGGSEGEKEMRSLEGSARNNRKYSAVDGCQIAQSVIEKNVLNLMRVFPRNTGRSHRRSSARPEVPAVPYLKCTGERNLDA